MICLQYVTKLVIKLVVQLYQLRVRTTDYLAGWKFVVVIPPLNSVDTCVVSIIDFLSTIS